MSKQVVKKIFKGIGRAIGIAFIVIEVVIILFLVVSKIQGNTPTIFGYQMYFIQTSSMSPNLEPGDVIVSKKYNGGELKAGEKDGSVVTYLGDIEEIPGDSDLITHRVIEIVDENTVITKGDNPINDPDAPISKDDIKAVMVYKTVIIDKIYSVINTTWGFWLFVFAPIAALIISEIVSLVKELKKAKEVADEDEDKKE